MMARECEDEGKRMRKKFELLIDFDEVALLYDFLLESGIEEIMISEVKNSIGDRKKYSHRGEVCYLDTYTSRAKVEILAETHQDGEILDAVSRLLGLEGRNGIYTTLGESHESSDAPAILQSPPKQEVQSPAPVHFTWKLAPSLDGETRSLTVVAQKCPGIFSKIVGVLTLNGFDIVSAKSYRQGNSTLDILKIRALPGEPFKELAAVQAQKDLREVLSGKIDLVEHLKRNGKGLVTKAAGAGVRLSPQIHVDNDRSLLFTTVDVAAPDTPGVLFKITDALFRAGFIIWMSQIDTCRGRIKDTFYIKDSTGKKAESPLQISRIKQVLIESLSGQGN